MNHKPKLKRVTAAETRPHRQTILRPGQPPETVVFAKDDDPESVHFAVFVDDEILAVASLANEAFPLTGETLAWRMRGVGTYPQARGSGYGTRLIQACIEHTQSKGGKYIWCNARVVALSFYTANGFEQRGDPFDIPGAGLHYLMYKKIS